jgi:hypothetical protein
VESKGESRRDHHRHTPVGGRTGDLVCGGCCGSQVEGVKHRTEPREPEAAGRHTSHEGHGEAEGEPQSHGRETQKSRFGGDRGMKTAGGYRSAKASLSSPHRERRVPSVPRQRSGAALSDDL